MANQQLHNPTYVGTSGERPGVFAVRPDGSAERVVAAEPGHSVYAVRLSPEGTRLVVGTRDRRRQDQVGQISIWERFEDGTLDDQPLLSCWQRTSVTAADFSTEDIALSGGLDGEVRVWKTNQPHEAAASFSAHQGPVLGLRSLTPQIAATVGADGAFKLWDLDRLICMRTVRDSGSSSVVQGLLNVEGSPQQGMLASLHPSGTLHLHRIQGDELSSKALSLPNGPAAAMTLAGDQLIAADAHALKVRALSFPDGSETASASCPQPVLQLASVSVDRILVIYRDGAAALWKADPLESLHSLQLSDARCATGPAQYFQFRQGKEHQAQRRERKLTQAREAAQHASTVDEVRPHLEALAQEGMSIEALVILAEWAREQNRPIGELRARLELAQDLPTEPWCAVHYYALATLLENLNEPAYAKEYFEKAAACDSSYRDTRDRAEHLSEARNVSPPGAVRDDLVDLQAATQEIEKRSLIGEPCTHPITTHRSEEPFQGKNLIELDAVQDHLDASWSEEEWKVHRSDGSVETMDWLVYRGDETAEDVIYAIELASIAGQRQLIHRIVLLPSSDGSPENKSMVLRDRLQEVHEQSENSVWVQALHKQIEEAIRRAIQAARQERSSTYF